MMMLASMLAMDGDEKILLKHIKAAWQNRDVEYLA